MAEGRNLVGVDIGASSVKVIQLKQSRKNLQVVRYGYAPLPPQTIIDGHIMSAGVVVEALGKIFQDNKIQTRDVAVGVYGQSVIVRKITVPMMTNEELDEQISWEAEQHIPFDIKVMSIDYEILRRRPEAGTDGSPAGRRQARRDQRLRQHPQARRSCDPSVVDINAFTIQNIFEHQQGLPDDGSIALLNVGAAVTSLNIVSHGISAFTREITNAGNAITEEIQKQVSVPYEQAEAYKCGGGPTQIVPQEVHQVISSACDALAGEIQRSLDFYLATSGEPEISRVFVSGGSALPPPAVRGGGEASAGAGHRLRSDVEPHRRHEVRERGGDAEPGGAAGRRARTRSPSGQGAPPVIRVNLLPQKEKRARGAGVSLGIGEGSHHLALRLRRHPPLRGHRPGALVLARADASCPAIVTHNNVVQANIDDIKRQIANHPEILAQLKELTEREDAIQKLQAARTGPTSVLLELSRVLTPRSWSDGRSRQARTDEARRSDGGAESQLGSASSLAGAVRRRPTAPCTWPASPATVRTSPSSCGVCRRAITSTK